jgi:hypothetical protein
MAFAAFGKTNMEYSVGSCVRVKLQSGDIVIAEIVLTFSASVRKKYW